MPFVKQSSAWRRTLGWSTRWDKRLDQRISRVLPRRSISAYYSISIGRPSSDVGGGTMSEIPMRPSRTVLEFVMHTGVNVRKAAIVTTSWDDGHPLDIRLAEMLARHGVAGTFYVPLRYEGVPVMDS